MLPLSGAAKGLPRALSGDVQQVLRGDGTWGPALGTGLHGQCRLEPGVSNAITLVPWDGNKLSIEGVSRIIPDAGVSHTPTGATSGVRYYIYAFANGSGNIVLEHSATAPTKHATGVMIKGTDYTRTLVGMAVAASATTWGANTNNNLTVKSWFNRLPWVGENIASGAAVSSTSFINISPSVQSFLMWAGELGTYTLAGRAVIANAGGNAAATGYIDGNGIGNYAQQASHVASGVVACGATGKLAGYSENTHTYQIMGSQAGAGTATFYAVMEIMVTR